MSLSEEGTVGRETGEKRRADQRILDEVEKLIRGRQTLKLATVDGEGNPEASYAPFLWSGETGFYIYVSELAQHTRNLLAGSSASILLVEDEDGAKEIFALRRLTVRCTVWEIERGDPDFDSVLEAMEERHGGVVAGLKRMLDFHLFRLVPEKVGRLVLGFGQAYQIEGVGLDRLFRGVERRVGGGGHRTAD
ncbi:MAG: HugZ family protein [Puniceicoccaceae bacterium]